jgi:hypothetical protein
MRVSGLKRGGPGGAADLASRSGEEGTRIRRSGFGPVPSEEPFGVRGSRGRYRGRT